MSDVPGVFDFVESASHGKKELVLGSHDPEITEKAIEPFVMNKAFSYHQDSILFANDMNERWALFKDCVYRYYLNSLRPRKRFSKWHKTKKDEIIDAICLVYNVNKQHAAQYYGLLSEEQREQVLRKTDKGGSRK